MKRLAAILFVVSIALIGSAPAWGDHSPRTLETLCLTVDGHDWWVGTIWSDDPTLSADLAKGDWLMGDGDTCRGPQHPKPDPQPTHGNDCTNHNHGNQEGNEDHCESTTTTSSTTTTTTEPPTTTTTAPVTTTTTEPPSTTTTTLASPTTTTTTTGSVTSTTEAPPSTTTTTEATPAHPTTTDPVWHCTDTNGFPFLSSQPCPAAVPAINSSPVSSVPVGTLPRTGGVSDFLLVSGLILLGGGLGLWGSSRLIK